MTPEEIKALQDGLAAEKARADKLATDFEELKKSQAKPEPKPDDKTLDEKVKEENERKAKEAGSTKALEAAFLFNHGSGKFIEEHKEILPKEVSDIFAQAEKESYDSPIDKANATKAALIQSFFALQAHLDLATPSHKSVINDYLKLTKKAKEERASEVFMNVFEPTLHLLKQVKKAEEIEKSKYGIVEGSDSEKAYKEKMLKVSAKHYLGEK